MDFDYTTETIIPETTGYITAGGVQGLEVPAGTTAQRPAGAAGILRVNTDTAFFEYHNGTTWVSPSTGTVTSVQASGGTTGLSFSGGPITTSGTLTLAGTLVTANGGTGLSAIGTASQVLGVNTGATALEYKTITAGTAITVTPAAGSITIANAGVTSLTGTANQVTVSAATGAVTLSLPAAVTLTTSLTISGLTANTMIYSGTAGLITSAGAATNGQLLIGSTGAAPVRAALTAGTAISVTNGAGSITIANTGVTSAVAGTGISVSGATGAVTIGNTGVLSFSAGTTGLTPNTATTGAVTLAGTLGFANGGTGLTSTPTNGQLDIGNGAGFTRSTLTQGSGITITNGSGTITIANAGVTSIAGTANQITASAATGAVTLSLPATLIAPGSVEVTTTLQVDGNTASSFVFSNASKQLVTTAAPTNGQLLIGSTGANPVAATLTAGTNISVVNAAGSITINNTSAATVSSVAVTGSTGLTVGGSPITTSGTITLTLGTELQGLSGLAANGMIARTGAGTYSPRTITGTASDITVTNGDGVAGNPTIDLATVTQSTGSTFAKISLDTKGRVTGNTVVGASDITTALGYTPVNRAGDTMSGTLNMGTNLITNVAPPVSGTDAANKNYVDAAVTGLSWKQVVRAATTAAGTLASSFANGSVIDGVTLATGDRILIKNQATQSENGIYTVNAAGAPTRATDADTGPELVGASVYVDSGTVNADTGWVQTTVAPITIGTSNIVWQQFSGSGSYAAGTGLTLTGNTFSLTSPVAVNLGGTGLTSTPANGQLLIGNGAGFTETTLTAGTAISVTNGAGSITVANTGVTSAVAGTGIGVSAATGAVTFSNTGVTSITGTANQITASAATGGVTLSLPASVTITTGLTVSGLTANTMIYSGTAGLITSAGAATNGQILIGSTGAAPVRAAITAGTGITVTNGAGSITIAATNTGTVTSVSGSGGTTGLTLTGGPITTTGTLTLGGTLAIANGGTGQTTATTAFNALSPVTSTGDLIVGNGANSNTRLGIGSTGQVLTVSGGTATWSTVGASSFAVNVGPSGSQAWVLVSGNTYNAAITHNLGTNNVVVQMADISTNNIVFPDLITITSTNVVTVQVTGNTRTLRVVIIANGASIAAGASTPSSVIVQANGVTVTGGPMTTLNFTGYPTTPTGASGVATIPLGTNIQNNGSALAGGPFSTINLAPGLTATNAGSGVTTITPVTTAIRTLSYIATSLDSPNNADWTVNALAPTIADPTNGAITVRQFVNTSETGVGFTTSIPTGATNMVITYKGRAQVAGAGAAVAVQLRLYTRAIQLATPAAVGAWSTANALTTQSVPTGNVFWQSYSQTIALSAFTTALVAGQLYQFELTRNTGVANNLAQSWLLGELTIAFT